MTLSLSLSTDTDEETVSIDVFDGMKIGRSASNDLCLSHMSISHRHALVSLQNGAWMLTDLGSHNGTRLATGAVLHKDDSTPLSEGMTLLFGEVKVKVEPSRRGEGRAQGGTTIFDRDMPIRIPSPAKPKEVPAQAPPRQAQPAPAPPVPAPPIREESAPPAPAVHVKPDSAEAKAHESLSDSSFFEQTLPGFAAGSEPLAAAAALGPLRARLLILNEADMRSVPINDVTTLIGRHKTAGCMIENRGVSGKHAEIEFQTTTGTFLLEDLGSQNGCFLGASPLRAGYPLPIATDSNLRIGPIEAVFRYQVPGGAGPSDRDIAQALVKARRLSKSDLAQSTATTRKTDIALGDDLLLNGFVKPRDWGEFAQALVASTTNIVGDSKSSRPYVFAIVLTAIAVGALFVAGKIPI